MATAQALEALTQRFPEFRLDPKPLVTYHDGRGSDQLWVRIPKERLVEVCEFLFEDERCRFEQVCDITCVDYLNFPEAEERFGVIYSLLSLSNNQRVWLKVFVNDPNPEVPSLTGIWRGANWMEREVFDMFGIRFAGHPDLRRILMPDGFKDYPLRKDYPLTGKGEREQFEVIRRDSA